MNSIILTRVALRSLTRHKGRSLLTMLGIILGIAALVSTLALGYGADKKIQEQIEAMGKNYIIVFPGNWMQKGKGKAASKAKTNALKVADFKAIETQCHKIGKISPYGQSNASVSYQSNYLNSEIKAGNEHFFSILNRSIKKGINFTRHHMLRSSRVAVMGEKAASEIFKSSDPLGKTIKIGKIPFTVIGVLNTINNGFDNRDTNLDIFVPSTSLQKFVTRSSKNRVGAIIISAKDKEAMPELIKQIRNILRDRHKIPKGDPDDFMIIDQESMAQAASGASKILQMVLLIIASISLLVGGVGVMNIMLVSVTERTKEIGIRMALGATDQMILNQFVLEATMLCLIGGIIGIVLGVGLPYTVSLLTGLYIVIKPISIIVAFAVTSCIGLFFGYYPAYKASRLKPVIALADI